MLSITGVRLNLVSVTNDTACGLTLWKTKLYGIELSWHKELKKQFERRQQRFQSFDNLKKFTRLCDSSQKTDECLC